MVLSNHRKSFWRVCFAILLTSAVGHGHVWAQIDGPTFRLARATYGAAGASDAVNPLAGINTAAASSYGPWRLRVKYNQSASAGEMKRLQIGREIGGKHQIWFGRFHGPLGYWSASNHHGMALARPVSGAGLIAFQDDGGPFATGLTGLLIEGGRSLGQGRVAYNFSFGLGARLGASALETLDLEDVRGGTDNHAWAGNFDYDPNSAAIDRFGIFLASTRMGDSHGSLDQIRQQIAGAYVRCKLAGLTWTGSLMHARNEAAVGATNFAAGFVQSGWSVSDKASLYARSEDLWNDRGDYYLARLGGLVRERHTLGARFELAPHQALRLELRSQHNTHHAQQSINVQWSAVLP